MIITNESSVEFNYVLPDGSTQIDTQTSNLVETEILTYAFTKVKSSDKEFLLAGETAQQTIVLTNNSRTAITNIFFKDIMSEGASYVDGSVVINDQAQPTYDLMTGFTIPDIASGESVTIKYTIQADNPITQNQIVNYGTISYTASETEFEENTNEVTIDVISVNINVIKEVDKEFAISGDILHYTSTITNSGNIPKTNLTFIDNIPTGTTFVENSVSINQENQPGLHPETGFSLPDLDVNESVVVEFDVKVE